jgi:hypothetical protein
VTSSTLYPVAYVFVEPEGGWTSMTETATLTGPEGVAGNINSYVSVAKSSIALSAILGSTKGPETVGVIDIFNEPEGGWVSSSSPNYTAKARSTTITLGVPVTFAQNAEVLTGGEGSTRIGNPKTDDLTYLWHAQNGFSYGVELSAQGLTPGLIGTTVTKDYAFAWDALGNVFVFDGN